MLPPKLLLVDDDPAILSALLRQLRRVDRAARPAYQIETLTSPLAALKRAEETAFDLVISDYRMPEMNGVEFLRHFREIQPNAVRMVLSGMSDLKGIINAINEAGIVRFISKPWSDLELTFAVETALTERELLLENQRLADELRQMRGLISRQEAELRRLERECPGITRVNWGPDGSVMLIEVDEVDEISEVLQSDEINIHSP